MDWSTVRRAMGSGTDGGMRRAAVAAGALAAAFLLAGCGGPRGDTLAIAGPTTASSTIIDLPPGPVSASAATVESRLRAAGVGISAIDRQSGLITARSQDNRFVDCGRIFETVGGRTVEFDGNARRIVLADPQNPSQSLVRTMTVLTSAGIGITPGVTNTVVVRQQHRVTIEVRTPRQVISTETREFTDRGFARFEDGTICRSSNAMNEALL